MKEFKKLLIQERVIIYGGMSVLESDYLKAGAYCNVSPVVAIVSATNWFEIHI